MREDGIKLKNKEINIRWRDRARKSLTPPP
jgi:hypothetical protein